MTSRPISPCWSSTALYLKHFCHQNCIPAIADSIAARPGTGKVAAQIWPQWIAVRFRDSHCCSDHVVTVKAAMQKTTYYTISWLLPTNQQRDTCNNWLGLCYSFVDTNCWTISLFFKESWPSERSLYAVQTPAVTVTVEVVCEWHRHHCSCDYQRGLSMIQTPLWSYDSEWVICNTGTTDGCLSIQTPLELWLSECLVYDRHRCSCDSEWLAFNTNALHDCQWSLSTIHTSM